MLTPVIMAGGSGTRLWPMSRQLNPKQFLRLFNEYSLLQNTLLRLQGLQLATPMVICNLEHRFMVAEQLRQLGEQQARIILEPVGRNTAPAIALAALESVHAGDDQLLLVLAADHYIKDIDKYQQQILNAIPLAEEGKLVTFGIVPTKPETGYGYVQRGSQFSESAYNIECFVEKPDLEKAQKYLDSGNYYWNSGIFLFRASSYLKELERFQPDILKCCNDAYRSAKHDLDFIRIDQNLFSQCLDISIDYAVMENTSLGVVVPLDVGWNDIGSWSALWEVGEKDQSGNVMRGDTLVFDTSNSLIQADHRLVSVVGVEDLVVVETKDAVFVSHKDRVQEVKRVVNTIRNDGRHEHMNHREVYRPWGIYDSIDQGERYQVKRITVKPGAKLSLQMHHHRAEHWVVVKGTAQVRIEDKDFLITENESTFIPVGRLHSLKNPGKIPLELIEVQSGTYLGEDDIIRYEDNYGRE